MIHIVRHGRTEANASGLLLGRADPGLDDVGRQQARALAAAVPAGARVVSSPLRRTRETADAFGGDVEVDERWIEMDYGEFDLLPTAEVSAETWARWRSDIDFRPPGGESHRDLAVRVWAALDALAAEAGERDIVVVTHVTPIKAAVAWSLGVGIEMAWRSFVAQASITRLGLSPRGPSLRSFNEVHHLDGLDVG